MAWIESHQGVADHPKTRKLARRLDISVVTAVGHLHCLWHWALDYAENGDLSDHDAEDIAIGARWEGDATEFCAALVAVRYLDEDEQKFHLHNWDKYAGKLIATREARAEAGRRGAKARWGKRDSKRIDESPDSDEEPLTPDGTNRTQPTNQPTSPTSAGEDDDDLRKYLEGFGFHPTDVTAALERLDLRQRFGEPVKDPAAWLRKVLGSMTDVRDRGPSAPKVYTFDDGVRMQLTNDGWREIDRAEVTA